jgi:hypothetical protein
MVHLRFYIFDIMVFGLLIGQSIERLIQEGQTRKLNICLGKNFKLPLSITHSLNAKTEPCPKLDPIEDDKVASLEHLIEPNLEEDAEFSSRKKTMVHWNPNLLMNCWSHLNLPLSSNLCSYDHK